MPLRASRMPLSAALGTEDRGGGGAVKISKNQCSVVWDRSTKTDEKMTRGFNFDRAFKHFQHLCSSFMHHSYARSFNERTHERTNT